jgi:diacylglycerol kinase family enzyme
MKPRRVALIVNGSRARSSSARAALAGLEAQLREPGMSCAITGSLVEARAAVHRAVTERAEVVLFGGGDGTLAMGLSLLAAACRDGAPDGGGSGLDEAPPLPHPAIGVLPLGTGNAFAHARGIGRGPGALAEQLARARDPRHPLVPFRPIESVGVRAPFCGFGVDAQLIGDAAEVASSAVGRAIGSVVAKLPGGLAERGGALRYAVSIATRSLPHFALAARPRVTVTNLGAPAQRIDEHGREIGAPLPAGEVLWEGACTMAAAATIPCFGFGLRMFPYAERRPDRFHLRASDAGLLEILRNTRAAFAGTYTGPNVYDFLADRVALSMSAPSPFEAGGEAMGKLAQVELALGPELLAI